MTLFLKIFLWFWLAMALIAGAVSLATWTFQSEPIVRQWQVVVGEAMRVHSQTAAQIFDSEGKEGLDIFLRRLENSGRIIAVGLFRQNGEQIAGGQFQPGLESIRAKALDNEETQFERSEQSSLIGKKTQLRSGETVVLITHWQRPQVPGFFSSINRTQVGQFIALILTAGLVCYALASYLSSPIVRLRRATQKLASGDLQTRIAIKRSDELGKLADDFDDMAERIESLVTSEKRLTQDISHELRSPLARMNVALELVRKKANDEAKPLIERIEIESRRLNEMIARLLMLSKLETGSENFEKREVNLSKLLEHIAADAEFEAQANNKTVKILQNDGAKIFGNESLLRSAIENVLRNALRYTKDGTAVEVSLQRKNKNAVIAIRDYGEGVPEEDIDKLFRPFYRVQTARERKSGGIGLGLAIAERAVHTHQGTIKAKNNGNGLIVEITLPVKDN